MVLKLGLFAISMTWLKEFTNSYIQNYSKPMNLGNPEEISLIDFAKEIII